MYLIEASGEHPIVDRAVKSMNVFQLILAIIVAEFVLGALVVLFFAVITRP